MTKMRVQITTGGHEYLPTFQTVFDNALFSNCEIWPLDHPQPFNRLFPSGPRHSYDKPPSETYKPKAQYQLSFQNPPGMAYDPSYGEPDPGFDVLVLNDYAEWDENDRERVKKFVEAGKGIVLLNYSLADNNNWAWWYQNVTGGLVVLADQNGMKKSAISRAASFELRPVGLHPITAGLPSIRLVNEPCVRGMWQAHNITPLLQANTPASDKVVAWIGPHPTARIVCIQPGASSETHKNPAFRKLVYNAVAWSGRKL